MPFDRLSHLLSPIVNGALWFFWFLQTHQMILALLSGVMLPFIFTLKKDEHQNAPFWKRFIFGLSMLCFLFGTIAPMPVWFLQRMYAGREEVAVPVLTWGILLAFTGAGLTAHIILRRLISPELDKAKRSLIKKTSAERDIRTDVRTVRELLPETLHYDPMKYIDLEKGIFIGLNRSQEPQYIPLEYWQKQHADIIGTTGAGKGVATGLLLYQSIIAGEGVFVLDPKNDEWAPHLYRKACEDAGKPFILIDLNKRDYQFNLIDDINQEQLEELFSAGFSLSEKGDGGADFYRIDDRKAALETSELLDEKKGTTLRSLFNSDYVQSLSETIKGFFGKMSELARLNAINTPDGASLKKIYDEGGCCYIIGSMRNAKIITTQRMILIRLIQLAELRDRVVGDIRPVAIFLDELKYHLSKPALEGLGAARDKGVHIIMAHQSIADLRDCPADLNPESVVGAVVENAKFKLVYRVMDPDTAEWVARMSGKILVDDESKHVTLDAVLTEKVDDTRTIRQAERYFIDENMILNLPDFVCFIFTTKKLPTAHLISPIKVKKQPLVLSSVPQGSASAIAPVKGAIDFVDEEIKADKLKITETHADLFFDDETIDEEESQHIETLPEFNAGVAIPPPEVDESDEAIPILDPHTDEWKLAEPEPEKFHSEAEQPQEEEKKLSLLDF